MLSRCKYLYLLPVLTLIISDAFVLGQSGSLRGRIVDSSTGREVEYACVLNFSLNKQVYTNAGGEFKLDARNGDTLVMYAVGYYYKKLLVTDSLLATQPVSQALQQQAYELSEARIMSFGSYGDFKEHVINLERPKTRTENLNNYIADIAHSVAKEAYEKAQNERKLDGISIVSVPIRSPEEKERIKLAKIMDKEQIRDRIYQKFNPQVVKKLTGLTLDDDIVAFMIFCKFSDAYLLEVSEYDLAARIALKYELYLKMKEDEKSMDRPLNSLDDFRNRLT